MIRRLPLRVALLLGWLAAAITHFLFQYRRREALRRIACVFGKRLTVRRRRLIAWTAWRNLCFNAVEAIRFGSLTAEKIERQPLIGVVREIRKMLEERDGGIVLATIHMGNWDFAGIAADLLGIPIFSMARRQKNPLTDEYLNRARRSFTMEVILNDSSVLKSVLKRIRAGKVFAILPDVRRRTKAPAVRFLGGEANLGGGAALFSRQCNCPIVLVVLRRVGWTKHEAVLLGSIHPDPQLDKTTDQARIMQTMMEAFDAEIAKTPEQYFWYNKRWVLDPIPIYGSSRCNPPM